MLIIAAAFTAVLLAPADKQDAQTQNSVEKTDPARANAQDGSVPAAEMSAEKEAPPTPDSAVLQKDETVTSALLSAGISQKESAQVVSALEKLVDFRQLKIGARFNWKRSAGQLTHFRLEQSPLEVFAAQREPQGSWTAKRVEVPIRVEKATIAALIESSLYQAIQSAGESAALVSLMTDVLAWDIDFYRDPRKGDGFKAVVEKKFVDDQFVGYGRVLAAEYAGEVGQFQVFWFAPKKGEPGYYLPDGRSAEKTFLATPLKFTRISSGFSRNRKHPILGYSKAHLGVDYAAPRGTPVWAMAKGKVTYAGWKGPNGKLVRIKHNNGLQSAYAHLHRIAKGIKPGVRVRQKQLIGYVGSTGRSTGPHLHFGVRQNGRFVNPQKLKLNRGARIPRAERARFALTIEQGLKALDAVVIGDVSKR